MAHMGKDIKPVGGGGIWSWIKGGFVAVAKSGAATETWKLVQPVVLGMIGAALTTLIGLAQRAPGLAIAGVAAFVFLAVAIGWAKIQAVRANRRQEHPPQPSEEAAPPPPELPPRKGYELTDDNLAGLERVAQALSDGINIRPDPIGDHFRRMADRPSPPPKRDVTLGEAMLYALRGRWGLDFRGFDPHNDSYDLETIKWQFEEMAEDGRIQVWGSDSWAEGRYTKVEPGEWKHLKIEWQSLIEGKPRTTSKSDISSVETHYNLMVNKAQIEQQFPDAPSTPDRLIPFVEIRKIAPDYGLSLESSDSPTGNLAYEIEGALRQAAARGLLDVEGRQFRGAIKSNDPLVPISPDHFEDYEFRHGRLHYKADNESTGTGTLQLIATGVEGVENVTFYDLHLSEHGVRAVLQKVAEKRAHERATVEVGLPDWMEGRTRITIGEAGCLAAKVSPTDFETSATARSKASELRYYVMRGRIPVAGESPAILAARQGSGGNGEGLPTVTFDTYVTVRDLENFLNRSLAVWLDVQEEATWRKSK